MLAQNLEVPHRCVEETQLQDTLPELEYPGGALKGKSSQATSEEGLDVELEDPRKKGMDIIGTVQVRRY